MLTEKTITDRVRKLAVIPKDSRLILGIGDDCAIYRPSGSAEDLLFTTDLFIENIHFRRDTHNARDAARTALARSLSDIAAMGGSPRFSLASVCVPKWADERWIEVFFASLAAAASSAGSILAGGDLSRGDTLACDITICGAVPTGKALLRSGARPSDSIYVSGLLGGSALGLANGPGRSAAWLRHLRPEPRLALGEFLRKRLRATSSMDLSDGLSLDLQRICLASGVAAKIDCVPRFRGATIEQALHGGEDYELIFTTRPGTRVPTAFDGLTLTRIGSIVEGLAGEVSYRGELLPPRGYDHFTSK